MRRSTMPRLRGDRGAGPAAAAVALLLAAVVASGCGDDDPAGSEAGPGGGLRVHLPAEALSLDWMRIELWNDDVVPPPGCPEDPVSGPLTVLSTAGEPAQADSCTRMEVFVWDYAGRPVRHEPEIPYLGRAWGWDTQDDDGLPVPSGYYFTRQECLDSRGTYFFEGHYIVRREREHDACEWPLWIEELVPGPAEPTLTYTGFPLVSGTVLLDPVGSEHVQIVFDNPFLVRFHAPGYETFEAEIQLSEFQYTDVDVALTPVNEEDQ